MLLFYFLKVLNWMAQIMFSSFVHFSLLNTIYEACDRS